ncbi:hypothetical protein [uncultured Jannaschia sp.]|uniref:hypothetical protein n=1 Tax=uncultured Jannaschia sp. TaxID=293347 RepID=UPI0026092F97|nr:hypothetical protein [uncultured Jannaschia sp.]
MEAVGAGRPDHLVDGIGDGEKLLLAVTQVGLARLEFQHTRTDFVLAVARLEGGPCGAQDFVAMQGAGQQKGVAERIDPVEFRCGARRPGPVRHDHEREVRPGRLVGQQRLQSAEIVALQRFLGDQDRAYALRQEMT